MSDVIVFDIETGPQSLDDLKKTMAAFDPNSLGSHPGEFDPANVRTGTMKDQAKIAEKIEASKVKHADAVADYESKMKNGEANHWQAIQDKAALSAMTGRILAIGYKGRSQIIDHVGEREERELIDRFWTRYDSCVKDRRRLVGFNIKDFDIPFIVQRSFILGGIEIPKSLFTQGKYLDSTFVDLRDTWKAGQWQANGSLDSICRACGLGEKPSDCSGADFSKYFANEKTLSIAIAYLANDLVMTSALAERLGVL